jgi:hypothetical protein
LCTWIWKLFNSTREIQLPLSLYSYTTYMFFVLCAWCSCVVLVNLIFLVMVYGLYFLLYNINLFLSLIHWWLRYLIDQKWNRTMVDLKKITAQKWGYSNKPPVKYAMCVTVVTENCMFCLTLYLGLLFRRFIVWCIRGFSHSQTVIGFRWFRRVFRRF